MQKIFTRRNFLKTASLATAGVTLSNFALADLMPPVPEHIGIQLYSVRDDMGKDPAGTLTALAKMGYREVEAYGYNAGTLFGMPYAKFNTLLKDNGLVMPSTHTGISLADYVEKEDDISDSVKKWIDAAPGLGLKYLITPSINESEWPKMDKMVKLYAAMGRYCKKAGVRFGHHNHEYEFMQKGPDGRLLMEWILHEVDPELISLQMDLCWVVYAKNNPLDWFRLYPGRWELCHAKDLATNGKRETAVIGEGQVDFKSIFGKSKEAGFKYYIVELEHYTSTPLEGVAEAKKALTSLF